MQPHTKIMNTAENACPLNFISGTKNDAKSGSLISKLPAPCYTMGELYDTAPVTRS